MRRSVEECNRRMLRARDAMDRTFAEPLCIARLAKLAEVSQAHFIRTFKATFAETPHRYLQRRRVERAMFLLRQTDRSVTEISLDVGFFSLGTFSRTFREIVGESPSDFRRSGKPVAVPTCFAMSWSRPGSNFGEARRAGPAELRRMLKTTRLPSLFGLDQDQALEFYVGKLGLEVHTDQDLGFMRWLTLNVPGDPGR